MVPTGQCATRALRDLLCRQPLSEAKVRFAWAAAVGPAVARATTVRLRRDGTLTVRAETEPWRLETHRSRRVIRERLAELLGAGVVRKVDVT